MESTHITSKCLVRRLPVRPAWLAGLVGPRAKQSRQPRRLATCKVGSVATGIVLTFSDMVQVIP